MHAKIKYNGIIAYTFLNKYEKNYQFLSSIKRDARERKLFHFFCLAVYMRWVFLLAMLSRVLALRMSVSLSVTSRCSIETDGQIEFIYGMDASFDLFYSAV